MILKFVILVKFCFFKNKLECLLRIIRILLFKNVYVFFLRTFCYSSQASISLALRSFIIYFADTVHLKHNCINCKNIITNSFFLEK